MSGHWFWGLITTAVVIWYATVVVYVAIKGVIDIKTMLARLNQAHQQQAQ